MPSVTILTEDRDSVVTGQQINSAYDLEYGEGMDRAAPFRFFLPGSDDRVSQIETINTRVRIYEDDDWVYLGVVEGKRLTIAAGGQRAWEITGRSMLAELARSPAGEQTFNGTDITGILPEGWAFDPVNGYATTGSTVLGRTVDESALLALVRIAETIGEHFIYRPDLSGAASEITSAATSIIADVEHPEYFQIGMTVEYDALTGVGGASVGVERNVITDIDGNSIYLRDDTGHVIDIDSTLRSIGDRMIIWLRDDQEDSGLIAEQSITAAEQPSADAFPYLDLDVVYDGAEIINKLTLFGAGNADARLTIASTSYSDGAVGDCTLAVAAQTLTYAGSGYDKEPRWKHLQFPTITPLTNASADIEAAADMLVEAGVVYLDRYAPEHEFYRLTAARVPRSLRPAQTVRVLYEDELRTIDKSLLVLELEHAIDSNGVKRTTPLVSTIDRYPTSEATDLQGQVEEGKLFQAHPQRALNLDTQNFHEIMDSDNAAVFSFELGPEVSRLIQATLRFKIDALRSPIKTIAGSASFEVSVTLPDHIHIIALSAAGSFWANLGITAPSGGDTFIVHDGTGTLYAYTAAASGGGDTATGDVDLSDAIESIFGVYDEDADNGGANTLAESDLVYKVDINAGGFGADLGAGISGPTYGWYEIDLTDEIADAAGVPSGQAFRVQISTATTGKYATITGRLVLRTVIQNTLT